MKTWSYFLVYIYICFYNLVTGTAELLTAAQILGTRPEQWVLSIFRASYSNIKYVSFDVQILIFHRRRRQRFSISEISVPTKGFGTSLALFGDLIMHKVEPDEVKPLMSFLVELLGCMSGQDNPNDFSILGINWYECIQCENCWKKKSITTSFCTGKWQAFN